MHPVVKGAIALTGISAVGYFIGPPREMATTNAAVSAARSAAPKLIEMPCDKRELPEGAACIPLVDPNSALEPDDPDAQLERRSRGDAIEIIPRRPDRPSDPLTLRFPLEPPRILHGFDDVMANTRSESPATIELGAERGDPVHALTLDGQQGKTRVVAMGRLVGNTVVTAHVLLDDGARPRTYLLVHGKLDGFGPDVKVGAELADGDVLGFVGDSGRPGVVSLYLEVRRVREETDLEKLDLPHLVDAAASVAVDARNVLPAAE